MKTFIKGVNKKWNKVKDISRWNKFHCNLEEGE